MKPLSRKTSPPRRAYSKWTPLTARWPCSGRAPALLNATAIGQAAGVKGQTVSAWLDLLEQNALALRLPPYHTNLSKRVVRTPKIYFLDLGLAAYLQGWRSVEPLLVSPQAGGLFESLVLGEVVRTRDHRGLSIGLHFWRTKEGEGVDFLIELGPGVGPRWLAIEAKLGIQNIEPLAIPPALSKALPALREIWIVTPGGEERRLSPASRQLPIRLLAQRLSEAALAAESA